MVAAAYYDDAARRIFVRSHSGRVWGFEGCSQSEWADFMSATVSKGEYLTRVLSRKPEVNLGGGGPAPVRGSQALRAAALNAFQPAHEIVDPKKFAGRRNQVLDLADALRVSGSVPIIFGDRGLGKSSLAAQGQLIAMGDTDLLGQLGARNYGLGDDETYIAVFVTCTDGIDSVSGLLERCILALEDIEAEAIDADAMRLVDRSRKSKVSLKVFEVETTRTFKRTELAGSGVVRTTEDVLAQLCNRLSETFDSPLLIIVDEMDRVADKSGLASIIKRLSTARLKFVLVGIAQDWSDLMLDHASLERQAVPIRVPRMSHAELADVVDRASDSLIASGVDLRISRDVRKRLVDLSGGFPWFVHVMGQAALLAALASGRSEVVAEDLIDGVNGLVKNKFAQHFADQYQRAVRDSVQREMVLRAFAEYPKQDIPTSVVYPALRSLGVTNPSIYLGHLCSSAYGEPLIRPGFQGRALVRFRNEMFRQYVLLAPSLYPGVANDVARAMRV